MKLLLETKPIWNAEFKKYHSQVSDFCPDCLTTSQIHCTREVSLSSLSRNSIDVVSIAHHHLDGDRIIHITDSVARYSVRDVVQDMLSEHGYSRIRKSQGTSIFGTKGSSL